MVLPTSSPSPLRNSPGFPPGSPRPHRGRTMHATQISTCARNSRRAVPPTPCRSRPPAPCRSRPPAPCRRRVGHVERCSTWTWGCGRGSTSHPRGNSVRQDTRATPRGRHHDPQHICHGDERATPRIADKIHHSAPGTATGWPPPMGRGRSQEATTAKTVDAADERMRTRSRHRNVPRDGWYFAPPWYFGSTSRPVPHHVANPTIPNTSATETNGPHLATDWISTPRRAPQLRKVVLPAPLHTWSTTLWLKNSSYQHKREGKYNFLDWFSSQNHREQPRRLHSDTQSEGASTIFRSKSCALPSRKGKCTQLSGVSEHALPDQELDEMDHKD